MRYISNDSTRSENESHSGGLIFEYKWDDGISFDISRVFTSLYGAQTGTALIIRATLGNKNYRCDLFELKIHQIGQNGVSEEYTTILQLCQSLLKDKNSIQSADYLSQLRKEVLAFYTSYAPEDLGTLIARAAQSAFERGKDAGKKELQSSLRQLLDVED